MLKRAKQACCVYRSKLIIIISDMEEEEGGGGKEKWRMMKPPLTDIIIIHVLTISCSQSLAVVEEKTHTHTQTGHCQSVVLGTRLRAS